MIVICPNSENCNNLSCLHRNKHIHYEMCDKKCNINEFYGATCIKSIIYDRKQKIKNININNDSGTNL